jgi:hypothetical protein
MSSVLEISPDASKLAILATDMFVNRERINKIFCPLFIVHGSKDEVINNNHSKVCCHPFVLLTTLQRLAKLCTQHLWKLLLLEDAGHHDIEADYSDELLDELINFIDFISPTHLVHQKIKRASSVPGTLSVEFDGTNNNCSPIFQFSR